MASSATGSDCKRSAIMIEPEPKPGTSSMADEEENDEERKERLGFQVNTGLIPQAQLDEHSELQGLGLNVFNQEEFEDGVMAQVDEAMAKEEEARLRRILAKEMKAVEDDFSMANQELTHINKVLESLPESTEGVSRDIRHTVEAVRKQRDNKMKHLKKLESRKSVLQGKIDNVKADAEILVGALGQKGSDVGKKTKKKVPEESERDRMIRLGHMTPFGTVIKSKKIPKIPKKSGSNLEEPSKGKHKLSKKTSKNGELLDGPSPTKRKKSERSNRFDEKDFRIYDREKDFTQARYQRKGRTCPRLNHSFRDQSASWEEEAMYEDSGEEYVPDANEWQPSTPDTEEEDDAYDAEQKKERKKSLREKHVPPAYIDEFMKLKPKKSKAKKDSSIHKARDDGNERFYKRRIEEYQKEELLRKFDRQAAEERGEEVEAEADEEFEGGLRVPGRIWSKLFQ